MNAAEYRASAERLRDAAKRGWVWREARQQLLDLAAIYETLAKATETLERVPF